MSIVIYGLYCPINGDLRYVGQAINLKRRLTRHIKDAATSSYKGRWIATLLRQGVKPELRVIRVVQPNENWRLVEQEEIAKAIANGCRLTNLTKGGDGVEWATPELREAWLESRSRHSRALWSERGNEMAAKIAASRRLPDARAKTAEAARLMHSDPEFKRLHRRATLQAFEKPEVRERLSKASRASWAANKEERCSAVFVPETRAKMSASAKARWSDPIKAEAARAANRSSEKRLLLSESAKRRSTPQYRAMMAEKTRLSWEKRRQPKG